MAFGFWTTPSVGAPGVVYDTAIVPLGTKATSNEGYEYIFLQGVASTILGSWVTFDEAFLSTGLDGNGTATLIGPVAVATAAVVANKYGWYGRVGAFTAGSGTVADNAPVFATDTVFICDDATVDNYQVLGAIWRSANTSALATVQINNPWVGLLVDAVA
jgi:hypothetical protein